MTSVKLNKKEPPPIKSSFPAVWDLVFADIIERDKKGKEKYGTRLQPFNGRNVLIDAYQEALDLVVYLRQAIFEKDYNEAKEEAAELTPNHFDDLLCDCPVCQAIRKGNKTLKEVVLDEFEEINDYCHHPAVTQLLEANKDDDFCTCPGAVEIYQAVDDVFRCRKCEKKFDRKHRP